MAEDIADAADLRIYRAIFVFAIIVSIFLWHETSGILLFVVLFFGIVFFFSYARRSDPSSDSSPATPQTQSHGTTSRNSPHTMRDTTNNPADTSSEAPRECLAQRLQQGVILKTSEEEKFADFGTEDPLPVEVCTICLVSYEHGDRVATSKCKHVFHQACILEWLVLNKDCPCCRQSYVDLEAAVVEPVIVLDRDS